MAASILTLKSLRQLDEEFIDQTLRRRIIRPLGRTRIGQYAFLGQAQNFITYNTGDSGEILFGQASHSEIAEEAGLIPRAEVYDYGKLFPIRISTTFHEPLKPVVLDETPWKSFVWQPAILIASRTLPDINAGIMISADREYNQGVTSRIVEEMFWHTGGLLATVFLNNGIEAINPEDINLRRIAQIKNFRGKA